MYPMAFIILTGLYLKSQDTVLFLLPFSVTGLIIAAYHNLVYYKFITVIVPCSESAPCTAQQLNWLGFITIPLLSFLTFSILLIFNLISLSLLKRNKDSHEK